MADSPPDKIDLKNPPKGAFKEINGVNWVYMDTLYSGVTGNRVGSKSIQDEAEDIKNADPVTNPLDSLNLFGLFGFDAADGRAITVRFGLIVLGGALAIAGFAMIVSGTKAAQVATNLIPAGRVANIAKGAVS